MFALLKFRITGLLPSHHLASYFPTENYLGKIISLFILEQLLYKMVPRKWGYRPKSFDLRNYLIAKYLW